MERAVNTMEVPFHMVEVDEETNRELLKHFHGERTGFVQVGPCKYIMPVKYKQQAHSLYNVQLDKEDVWIITHPRSGTTLTQELSWLVLHEADFEGAAATPLGRRSVFVEFGSLVHPEVQAEFEARALQEEPDKVALARQQGENRVSWLQHLAKPRLIKSHLPLSLLPTTLLDTAKVIYVARHPKDVAVSYYHMSRSAKVISFQGDFPTFWDLFERGLVLQGPFWPHLREAWQQKDHPNMLFLFYEDIVQDLAGTVQRVSRFLGRSLTAEQEAAVVQHLQIDNFRAFFSSTHRTLRLPGLSNPGEQEFIRKGKVGGWKEYFSPELNARADRWIEQNLSTIPGLAFPLPQE